MHANARLTVWARREIVRRHQSGVSQAEIARQLWVSRATVSKWWHRYQGDPDSEWFVDRSSRPRSCPKVERFNRTLTQEWAYARPYLSENDRNAALQDWIHIYNHHRGHTAIGGPPITRVNNQGGSYT